MREVIERAAGRFGWKGHKGAAGMACNLEKDAHMALFAEVEVKGAKVIVARIPARGGSAAPGLAPDRERPDLCRPGRPGVHCQEGRAEG